jgi:alcohol dehydrogenase
MKEQQVIFEDGAIFSLQTVLKDKNCKKLLIIAGSHFQSTALPDQIKKTTKVTEDLIIFYRSQFSNSKATISKLAGQFTDFKPDALLVIGGGGVIDCAKVLLLDYYGHFNRKPLFIAAPTTSGSGSEATSFAVVYENEKKTSLDDPVMKPDIVIIDSSLTASQSLYTAAISGIDALSQAIESVWNINATEASIGFSNEAINIILQYLPAYIKSNTPESRKKMMWAAYLAGKAINITRTTGPHALSYYLTFNYNVQHGQAVALFLPKFFLYNYDENNCVGLTEERIALLKKSGDILYSLLGVENGNEASIKIEKFIKETGLALNLNELGLKEKVNLEDLLNSVNEERFNNNPVPFYREKLKKLLADL